MIEVYYTAADEIFLWSEAGPMVGESLAELEAESAKRHQAVLTASLSSPGRRVLTMVDFPATESEAPLTEGETQ